MTMYLMKRPTQAVSLAFKAYNLYDEVVQRGRALSDVGMFLKELGHYSAAREAFLTSTTAFVLPVVQIDEAVIGNGRPGSAALELRRIYEEFALGG